MNTISQDAKQLAEKAFNAAVKYIQDQLAIEYGDNAAIFFADSEAYGFILTGLEDYAQHELDLIGD
jgi:hypothetical protein